MVPSSMASHPGTEAEKHPHTMRLPPPCLTIGTMFLLWNVDVSITSVNETPVFQKVPLSTQNIILKGLRVINVFFW